MKWVLTNMMNWVFLEGSGGTQSAPEGRPGVRNVCCNLCVQRASFPHPARGWGVCSVEGRRATVGSRTPGSPESSDGS